MKKILFALLLFLLQVPAAPALTIEITQGAEGALPIAVVPFAWDGAGAPPPAEDIAAIVRDDLQRSGRFNPMPVADMLARPSDGAQVEFRDWKALGMESLAVGQVRPNGSGGYLVRFQLFDVFKGEQLAGYNLTTTERDLRFTAHTIADLIYEKLTGQRGAFATRIAYVTSSRAAGGDTLTLKVADADGHNPQVIVTSTEPLMSPAWSPDGRSLAYVSFEKRQAAIYVQEVFTGRREKLASYSGINGAPAWSPDGRKLALTLSKDGSPDIYVLNINRKTLTRLTTHYGIDTEPAWSPDGQEIVFTSDRGGRPQIYKVPSYGGKVSRVTFEGDYNARASYAPDGGQLTLVTRQGRDYRIGLLDLASGALQVLSDGSLDESPSFAPNGSMVIYATKINGRGELAAISVDGNVKQRLALQEGDVREPVWSPYTRNRRNQ
ncbi:MAG: Tol-Pal system beta propeller repeat protein TolB [Candidatus Sedimenticola endophacoides]|uniref:Tol-Pal system protein TolB n=2 Tax=Candidatus Sedimenticola endophacoides TaxID=2548426 RepID=A0A6N4E463_9GAMM|nr:MAG: Tol-Pal system beta propeller repeat protein TolB [Candidatus Sedimenticola endophacoides]OQX34796.1 MAG: Tol-Pal system beta propeller repeat protein TolB [Candidatus Sedimenticola endophacoides]OQX41717.1 MAG: Tol-Pal system beta propeller repeat protein TolB [Candidatus Sedimenticola endophacoides]OQX43785.1 MAG: Tol-Pal system beta propeller repeat protein TolB [Candidatus Sedimenticola endophacoides]PUD97978.1 MAG: Tol-Pal system beta propeller repeat protein TolB [Candidatus Sedim